LAILEKYFNLCRNGKGITIVNNFVSQNDKVQIDYPIILASSNRLVQIDKVVFFMLIILSIFLLENLIKKTMNWNSEAFTFLNSLVIGAMMKAKSLIKQLKN